MPFISVSALSLLLEYKYLILFPLAAFEGPVVSLLVGFLVRAGFFNFWLSFLILLLGDIIPDSFFYLLGRFGNKTKISRKYFSESSFFSKHFNLIEKLWFHHTFKTMFFGKLAYGLALPFLVSAGAVKLPFKKFIFCAIPISIFQFGILMTVGYELGRSFQAAAGFFRYFELGIAAVIIILVIYVILSSYARERIHNLEQEEEKRK